MTHPKDNNKYTYIGKQFCDEEAEDWLCEEFLRVLGDKLTAHDSKFPAQRLVPPEASVETHGWAGAMPGFREQDPNWIFWREREAQVRDKIQEGDLFRVRKTGDLLAIVEIRRTESSSCVFHIRVPKKKVAEIMLGDAA